MADLVKVAPDIKTLISQTPATVAGWKELARTTLGGVADAISVASLANKKYYMILGDYLPSGNVEARYRFNSDSGTNYAHRNSAQGGSDTTSVSQTQIRIDNFMANAFQQFDVSHIANLSSKEKLMISHVIKEETGAANPVGRGEVVSKWANTSVSIDTITANNAATGDFASGSELVILGWDPADTHTANFWEELVSKELASAGDTFDSGTFAAKKYLWVQYYIENSGAIEIDFQFNSDTGTNYNSRYSNNGAADGTQINGTKILLDASSSPLFVNNFIINNSAQEKLLIGNMVEQNTAGAGNAVARREMYGKWANTASQITSIQLKNTAGGDMDVNTIMKVWGAN